MVLTLVSPPRPLFRIHKNGSPLVWPISQKHSIVTFENPNHALYVAMVTESHYKTHKEWPKSIEFSYVKEVNPMILGIDETTRDDMKILCARWNLGLLVIEDIQSNGKNRFSFNGKVETFEIDNLSRIKHLNSLLWDPGFSI